MEKVSSIRESNLQDKASTIISYEEKSYAELDDSIKSINQLFAVLGGFYILYMLETVKLVLDDKVVCLIFKGTYLFVLLFGMASLFYSGGWSSVSKKMKRVYGA